VIEQSKSFFRVFFRGFSDYFNDVEARLRQDYLEKRALGRTTEDILSEWEASRKGDLGLMRQITSGIELKLDTAGNTIFQLESNNLEGEGELFKWTLDPSAEHCDSCLHQASLGARAFQDIPIPTTQPTHGETNCTAYCKCTIEVVE
jgi:hypothetical protein